MKAKWFRLAYSFGEVMPRPISATIAVSSLSHNLQRVANGLQQSCNAAKPLRPRIWAVIKANAYGHGIDQAVQGFAQAEGLAMLDLNEAVRCREQIGRAHVELQSLMRISYAVFSLIQKKTTRITQPIDVEENH